MHRQPKTKLGIWNPKPKYHFKQCDKRQTTNLNIARIAHLINNYDDQREEGIVKTQISGNDFMLQAQTNLDNLEDVLNNTILIAARETTRLPLQEYLAFVHKEFQEETYREQQRIQKNNLKINHHSKMRTPTKEIEKGITYELQLKQQRNYN